MPLLSPLSRSSDVTLGAQLSIGGTGEEVSTRTEVVADGAERSQEPLGVLGGFEGGVPFSLAPRQVRILRPVVQALVSPMFSVRQHSANRGRVASQLIGDHDAWLIATPSTTCRRKRSAAC